MQRKAFARQVHVLWGRDDGGSPGPLADAAELWPECIKSSDVVLPLVGGPEVAPGNWSVGDDKGMVFVMNLEG